MRNLTGLDFNFYHWQLALDGGVVEVALAFGQQLPHLTRLPYRLHIDCLVAVFHVLAHGGLAKRVGRVRHVQRYDIVVAEKLLCHLEPS